MGWLKKVVRFMSMFCTDGGVGLLVVGAEGLVVHIKEEDTATVDTGSDGEIL